MERERHHWVLLITHLDGVKGNSGRLKLADDMRAMGFYIKFFHLNLSRKYKDPATRVQRKALIKHHRSSALTEFFLKHDINEYQLDIRIVK